APFDFSRSHEIITPELMSMDFLDLRRTRVADTKLTFCNGVVFSRTQCQRSLGDWLHAILEFCQSLHFMEIDISSAPRPTGATQGRTTANEDHRFVEGPRDVQCGSPAEIPLFFPPVGKTSRTEIAERPRATADLLFEIGRLGAGSAAHREHVHGIAAILDDTFTDRPDSGFEVFRVQNRNPRSVLALDSEVTRRNRERLRLIGSIVSADAEQYVTPRKQQVQKRRILRGVRSEQVRVRVSPDVGIVAHVDIFERHFFRQFGEVPQFDRAVERPLNLESRILCKNYRSK
ncbi:unnamed protein product, partial [Nesidiocoris tenuis]